jgi:hypothetical protein
MTTITTKVRDVHVEWAGKRITRIVWAELLPIIQFWSRCVDQFNPTPASQHRAARRLASLNAALIGRA